MLSQIQKIAVYIPVVIIFIYPLLALAIYEKCVYYSGVGSFLITSHTILKAFLTILKD
jgi:hypothetical protein